MWWLAKLVCFVHTAILILKLKLNSTQKTTIRKCSHKRKAFIRSANVVLSLCCEKKQDDNKDCRKSSDPKAIRKDYEETLNKEDKH